MKCLVCKHLGENSARCRECENSNNFDAKSDLDIIHEGIEVFYAKMRLPQYEEYTRNDDLRNKLLLDCTKEARFRNRVNTQTLTKREGSTT